MPGAYAARSCAGGHHSWHPPIRVPNDAPPDEEGLAEWSGEFMPLENGPTANPRLVANLQKRWKGHITKMAVTGDAEPGNSKPGRLEIYQADMDAEDALKEAVIRKGLRRTAVEVKEEGKDSVPGPRRNCGAQLHKQGSEDLDLARARRSRNEPPPHEKLGTAVRK